MSSIITIPALGDNFIYLCGCGANRVFAVDPCDAGIVLNKLGEANLKLTHILITHHHWDHTAGVEELKGKTRCMVIAGQSERIAGVDKVVGDGEKIVVGDIEIEVILTAGHTRGSVCYYAAGVDGGVVFTGDTMFVGGCGRIMEGSAEQMYESLMRIGGLDGETLVYPGHDYTVENYEFGMMVEPDNSAVKERLEEVKREIGRGGFSVPSQIKDEWAANVFLRSGGVEVFAELRRLKNRF